MLVSDQPTQVNPLILNQQKALMEMIGFSKNRQWAITNYSVLIYAGIFGVAQTFKQITSIEKAGLISLAILTAVCAIWLQIRVQGDAGKYRKDLEAIHFKWLSEHEREVAGIKPYPNPALRGVSFLVALIGVVVIGAFLVIYSLWRMA